MTPHLSFRLLSAVPLAVLLAGCTSGADEAALPRPLLAVGDSGLVDADGDGSPAGTDCDDADPFASPDYDGRVLDRCNALDEDCDGAVDEDCDWSLLTVDAQSAYYYGADRTSTGFGDQCGGMRGLGDVNSLTTYPVDVWEPTRCASVLDALDAYLIDAGSPGASDLVRVGGVFVVGEWIWEDGSLIDPQSWAAGEPSAVGGDRRCVDIDRTTLELYAADCTAADHTVCDLPCGTWYADADGDGFGAAASARRICGEIPDTAVDNALDCDDLDPGIGDICDPFADADGDGVVAGEDCDDEDPWSFPEAYDGCRLRDDNCNGERAEDCIHDDTMGIQAFIGDTAYYLNLTDRTWADARGVCQLMGGDLLVIPDPEEQAAFEGLMGTFHDTWLGLNGEDGDWDWVDGTPFDDDSPSWVSGHPRAGSLCAALIGPVDSVFSDACTDVRDSYCEVDCQTYYLDLDGDGVGRDDTARLFCGVDKPDYVSRVGGDCDDLDPEVGDTIWYLDADGDGYYGLAFDQCESPTPPAVPDVVARDCDETDPTLNPGNALDVCNGLDDDCDGEVDENCPCTLTEGGGSGYLFCGEAPVFWEDAERYCAQQGGSLVTIDDAAENALVLALAQEAGQSPWLGGSDGQLEGTWVWADGAALVYDNWHPGEPNDVGNGEDCLELRADGAWNDAPCSRTKAFVCELPCQDWFADEDGDGFAGTNLVRTSCGVPNAQARLVAGEDCDDSTMLRSPANTEWCDDADVDEDCDGLADDADGDAVGRLPYTVDADGDGYGGAATTLLCDPPAEAVTDTSDCDDTTATIGPDAPERCNGVDDDCDGRTDEDLADSDGDGQCDLVDPCPGANPDDFDRDGICDDALHVSALGFWPGRDTTLIAANAPAGARVYFLASVTGEGAGSCLLSDDGSLVCADLVGMVVLGNGVADAGGNAFLQVTTPASFAPGTDVWVQALHVQDSGAVTPVLQQVVQSL